MIQSERWYREAESLSIQISQALRELEEGDYIEDPLRLFYRVGPFGLSILESWAEEGGLTKVSRHDFEKVITFLWKFARDVGRWVHVSPSTPWGSSLFSRPSPEFLPSIEVSTLFEYSYLEDLSVEGSEYLLQELMYFLEEELERLLGEVGLSGGRVRGYGGGFLFEIPSFIEEVFEGRLSSLQDFFQKGIRVEDFEGSGTLNAVRVQRASWKKGIIEVPVEIDSSLNEVYSTPQSVEEDFTPSWERLNPEVGPYPATYNAFPLPSSEEPPTKTVSLPELDSLTRAIVTYHGERPFSYFSSLPKEAFYRGRDRLTFRAPITEGTAYLYLKGIPPEEVPWFHLYRKQGWI